MAANFPRIYYFNKPGAIPNQVRVQMHISSFVSINSLKDYYYQIRYTEDDALINYYCWDGANGCFVLQGSVMANSVPLTPPAVQTTGALN